MLLYSADCRNYELEKNKVQRRVGDKGARGACRQPFVGETQQFSFRLGLCTDQLWETSELAEC
jgi:hypothetical protein